MQLNISTQFNFIWPIDRTLSGATTLGQSGPGSNGNKRVLHILQSSSVTEASLLNCLVSYPEHSLEESAEMQLMYFVAPATWASVWVCVK